MELKIYLRILLRKWWIVIPALLITFTSTVVFTFTQGPTYRAPATFVVAPTSSFEEVWSFVDGLDTLSSRKEIASTYAKVATSRLIKDAAADELNLSEDQRKGLSVDSQLLEGTNVLEIAVEGNDPALARDFANMVGDKTRAYVQELYETYDIRPLDRAPILASPIRPNKVLNLALGAVFGLALGVALTFLSEYLQAPLGSMTNVGILDDETGAYNKRYFKQRLGEEMSRAWRNKYPLSLALMNVDQLEVMGTFPSHRIRSEALRKVAVFLRQYLREEDILAWLDGTIFAFLLPDMPGEKAQDIMEKLQTKMAWTPFEMEKSGVKLNLSGAVGVAAYQHNGTGQDEFLAKANHALQQAEAAGYGKVCLLAENRDFDDNGS